MQAINKDVMSVLSIGNTPFAIIHLTFELFDYWGHETGSSLTHSA